MKCSVFISPTRNDTDKKLLIQDKLISAGFSIDEENPDVVIYVGGDGTFLRAVNHYLDRVNSIKFLGICYGNLGFFYDYRQDDIDEAIKDLVENNIVVKSNRLLEAKIQYENDSETINAVNEIRIENPFHTLICDVFLNERYLETYRGNGLLTCSSLGSTAYNKSLGGALLPPNKDLLELTEIVSIQNNVFNSLGSPIILDSDDHIILKGDFKKAVVGFDFSTSTHESPTLMDIYLSNKCVNIIHKKTYSYVNKIRNCFTK